MKYILLTAFCLIILNSYSQNSNREIELIGIESRTVSGNGSEASFNQWGVKANLFRIKMDEGKKGFITGGVNYSNVDVNIKLDNPVFDEIQEFSTLGLNFTYIRPINKKWRFIAIANPTLNSNFTEGLKSDDLYFNLMAFAIYSHTPKSRFTFGLMFTNTFGLPFPVPVASYWRKLNDHWELNLGFPRLGFVHKSNKKIKTDLYFEFQGYKANISKNFSHPDFNDGLVAEKVRYSDFITGIGLTIPINKFRLKLDSGYTLGRTFKLQNADRDDVFEFDLKNNLTLGFGLSYTL